MKQVKRWRKCRNGWKLSPQVRSGTSSSHAGVATRPSGPVQCHCCGKVLLVLGSAHVVQGDLHQLNLTLFSALSADDEKTKQKKKKLAKSFKSKQRFQKMDAVQKQKADSWKAFISKGTKKKSGLAAVRKKGSMFSVPEGANAKVGVVGSGQGMTEYGGKRRHDFVYGGASAGAADGDAE